MAGDLPSAGAGLTTNSTIESGNPAWRDLVEDFVGRSRDIMPQSLRSCRVAPEFACALGLIEGNASVHARSV